MNQQIKDLEIRKVTSTDSLVQIAELIYKTDPYIYPYWFGSIEEACEILPKLMLEDKFIFNVNNMTVAVDPETQRIVGLVCTINKDMDLSYDYSKLESYNERYRFTIQNYIRELIREVQEHQFVYVCNVCVHESYRGQKVGERVLRQVIEEYKRSNYNHIALDVLCDNPSAIRLYVKLGFVQTSEVHKGFNDPAQEEPDVISMRHR